MRKPPLRVASLALATLFASAGLAPLHAQPSPAAMQVTIAPMPLGQALNELARQARLQMSFPADLVAGKTAPAVSGTLTAREALDRVLAGSGLEAQLSGDTVLVRPASRNAVATLPTVAVTGRQEVPQALPPVYAGGQVARGGRLGMLGNVDMADAPFSATAYTAELLENQQAKTLIDVMANDPSVQAGGPWHFDNFYIRGFTLNREEIAFDGLYGIASTEGNVLEGVERVEVLRGPSSLLGGAAPRGTAGGGINLVPKRAGEAPLTRVTANYQSDANAGAHLDLGRRFGPAQEFGIRLNAAYRNGEVSTDRERQRVSSISAGLDYRGDRLKLSADLGASEQRIDGAKSNFYVTSPTLPRAPSGSTNVWPSWSFQNKDHVFGLLRADYEATDRLSFGLAYGGAKSKRKMNSPFGLLTNSAGDIAFSPSALAEDTDTRSLETTARLKADTGPVAHQLVLAYTDYRAETSNYQPQSNWSGASNLYAPAALTRPGDLVFDQPLTPLSATRLRSYAITDTLTALDDRLIVIAGIRHQRIRVDAHHWATGAFESRYEKSANTPALGIVVKPRADVSVYANYIEALSQGDASPSTASNPNEVFAPFVSRQAEIGTKVDWGRLTTTFSAFQIRRPSGFLDANNFYSIAGEQRNRGLELQAFGEVARGVRVLGGIAWTRAIMEKTQDGKYDGKEAAGTSRWTVKLGGEWDIPGVSGLTATARLLYASSQAFNADNSLRLPSWTRVDIGARYATRVNGHAVVFRAAIQNLTDRRYWDSQPAYQTVTYAAPRTFFVSTTVDF